jgi:hypothetical protein
MQYCMQRTMHSMNAIREGAIWLIGTSLPAYLVRGAASVALAAGGFALLHNHPVVGIVMVFAALVPIGGCPACWLGGTIGAACAYKPTRNPRPQD